MVKILGLQSGKATPKLITYIYPLHIVIIGINKTREFPNIVLVIVALVLVVLGLFWCLIAISWGLQARVMPKTWLLSCHRK